MSRSFARRAALGSLLAAALLIAGVCLWEAGLPQRLSAQAQEAAFAGEYVRMEEALERLEEKAQGELYARTLLACASMADYRGDREQTEALLESFYQQDAPSAELQEEAEALQNKATYHQALKLFEEGEYAKAARTAASLKDYPPAKSLAEAAEGLLATPVPSPTPSPVPVQTSAPIPTEEPAGAVATPAPQKAELLPEGRLALGKEHGVFLRDDGTVLGFGENSCGQLDVGEWSNVVAVAAGAYHTLGLTAEGRVLAAGDNRYGQTDTAFFLDAVQIAAGDWDSYALAGSGEALSCGYHENAFLENWERVEKLYAGSYGVVAMSAQGPLASHPGLLLETPFVTAALSRGYAVGVDAEGNARATTATVPRWSGVERISAGENAVLALTADGEVLSHFFDQRDALPFVFEQPVVALCAGADWYAFVLADGSLELWDRDGGRERLAEKVW